MFTKCLAFRCFSRQAESSIPHALDGPTQCGLDFEIDPFGVRYVVTWSWVDAVRIPVS